jgi:hypothetical protein
MLPEGSEAGMPVQGAAAIAPAPPEPQAVAVAEANARTDAHCKDVAAARAHDGDLNGLDDDTQRAVYNGTYTDCMTWAATHGSY